MYTDAMFNTLILAFRNYPEIASKRLTDDEVREILGHPVPDEVLDLYQRVHCQIEKENYTRLPGLHERERAQDVIESPH